MDEHTLNDLLECSVCLERLDTSSKVLPCQHTFCRKCLEVILSSRHELRCPECRVLVDIKIDDLPPNVLLMRILEGMKNAAAKTEQKHHNQLPEQQPEPRKFQNDAAHQMKSKLQPEKQFPQNIQQQHKQLPLQPQQQHAQQYIQSQRRCPLPHAYALFDFVSNESTDLNFKKGDLILLKRKIDVNWYVGQLNGKEGTFPINYVKVVVPLQSTAQCIALYDFKMGPNEEEGCLAFQKGTVIQVLRRVDHNWAEGRIGTAIGIFPIAFVEMNVFAKKLLDNIVFQNPPAATAPTPATMQTATSLQLPTLATPIAAPQTSPILSQQQEQQQLQTPRNLPTIPVVDLTNDDPSDSTTPTLPSSNSSLNNTSSDSTTTTSSSNSSSNSVTSTPNQSQTNTPQHTFNIANNSSVRYRDIKEKRHSLNALLSAGISSASSPPLSVLQANRHSAEILSIPSEMSVVTQNLRLRNGRDDSCFTAAGNDNIKTNSPTFLLSSVSNAASPQTTPAREQQQQQFQQIHARANVLKTNVQKNVLPTLPWGYLALYSYKPLKCDELELKKGCVYIVTERCLDGWFKGRNWQDISGVFPGNYVTPLRQRDQQQLMHQCKYVPSPVINMPVANYLNQLASPNSSATLTTTHLHPPPDLPLRHLVTNSASNSAVRSNTLGQTVEAFFNRSNIKRHNNEHNNATPKDTQEREVNQSPSSSSSAAVNLMKRLAQLKSRSKSPNISSSHTSIQNQPQLQQQTLPINSTNNHPTEEVLQQQNVHTPAQLQYVHVRSGSCPSQLLQSLPIDSASAQVKDNILSQQSQQQQLASITPATYGSQRVKGNKERPQLQNVRQSMDGLLLNIFNNSATVTSPIQQLQLQQQQLSNGNPLLTKCGKQQQQQQMNANMNNIIQHRKSQSLDANCLMAPTITAPNHKTNTVALPSNITTAAIVASATTKSTQNTKECRFRCVVPYPPNSEIELELHIGDIIYVQRKQKNGWYKGTHARTQKTGLFPASFVEPDV